MLETLSALPPVHVAYLALVVTAFCTYGGILAGVYAYVNLKS